MHNRFYAISLLAGLFFLTPLLLSVAQAKRLTPDQCSGLRQLRQELVKQGVGKTIAKGAKWGADNLNDAQLSDVGAFLKLGEEIQFRCSKTTIGRKKKSVVRGNVPPPVRNPRRKRKELAEKAKPSAPDVIGAVIKNLEISPEVISAVTDKKTETTASGTPDSADKSPEN